MNWRCCTPSSQRYFVSESSVYRLFKAHDLITSPAFVLMKAADRFQHPTTAPNQLWQTDFTYLKVIGWGWFYLSTVLDDYSRYILAWKLCDGMTARDVSDTLSLALESQRPRDQRMCITGRGCYQTTVRRTSPQSSETGSMIRAWAIPVARPIIR